MSEFKGHELPFWGLAAFCIASPISIAAANAAWVCTLILWVLQARLRSHPSYPVFKRTALDSGFGLFFFVSLLSLWVSLEPGASFLEFRSLGLMVVYYLFAWNAVRPEERRLLVFCLLASATLAAAYGIGEYCTGRDLLGHYDPASNKIGGFFSMHLTFTTYLVMTACLVAGILLWAKPGKKVFAAGVPVLALMLTAIFLCIAKAAILAVFVGGAVVFGLRGRRHFALVLGAAVLLVSVFAFWKFGSEGTLLNYFADQYRVDAARSTGPVNSNTQRLYMWWAGLRASCSYFLNGVGLHAVEAVYPTFRHALAKDPNQWHLHSNFLQLGVTRGFFGLTAFLYLFMLAFWNGYRRLRTCGDPWEKGLTAGVLGGLSAFLVCGLTEYSWGDSEVLMALYMVMGLAVSSPVPASEKGVREVNAGREPLSGKEPGLERNGISLPGRIFFPLLLVLLIGTCFLLDPVYGSTGARILTPAVGAGLLALLVLKPFHRSAVPLGTSQAVACIVVFSGYNFTRQFWVHAEDVLPGVAVASTAAAAIFLFNVLFVFFVVKKLRSRFFFNLFDLALLGAALLWISIALGTNLLLQTADMNNRILVPPFLVLLPLCTMVILFYGATRLLYAGERMQNLFLAGLALALILYALI